LRALGDPACHGTRASLGVCPKETPMFPLLQRALSGRPASDSGDLTPTLVVAPGA